MDKLNLPEELIEFLKEGKQLEYDESRCEAGYIGLKSLDQLSTDVVWIDSDESPLSQDDPHAGEYGYYEVPAVSLTGYCKTYDPEFILLWLPNERMFGTWDGDHRDLRVFPGITWQEIIHNPLHFLSAQWDDYDCKISEYFKPYPKYKFKQGSPF